MRLIYADPGLLCTGGHHVTACANIIRHAQSRGITTEVYASTRMADYLPGELGAKPLFRGNPTKVTDDDPFCGFMTWCMDQANFMQADLCQLERVSSKDVIYIPSVQGPEILGLGGWLARFKTDQAPTVVVNLNFAPGLEPAEENGKRVWLTRDPRIDPRGTTYRFAGRHLQTLPTLHIVTEMREWIDVFSELLMREVHLMPTLPIDPPKTPFKRGARKRLTVVTLGHQWEAKGFHLIPEVFADLLKRPETLRLVAHNSNNGGKQLPETRASLEAMASAHEHVIYDGRVLDGETYQALLDAADLLLCPYSPNFYGTTLSAVVTEAIANGIPVVVPAGTELANFAQTYGVGSTFRSYDAQGVLEATHRILDDFDGYADRALEGAKRWGAANGAAKFLDKILAFSALRDPR